MPWVLLLVLWGVAFSVACHLTGDDTWYAGPDDSVIGRIFGSSRVVLGEDLYEVADLYFHKGVPHQHKKAFTDIFQRWRKEIAPSAHVHAGDAREVSEIIPWIRFATRMNPHDVRAYLTGAYWLGKRGKRPDLALKILREALRNNPRDYRIYLEKARIHMLEQDAEKAANALETGIRLWPNPEDPEDERCRLELAGMFNLRAFLYELKGENASALKLLRRSFAMFPGKSALGQRVAALERGESRQAWAEDTWSALFGQRHACARGAGADAHEHEHEQQHHSAHEPAH